MEKGEKIRLDEWTHGEFFYVYLQGITKVRQETKRNDNDLIEGR